MPRHPSRSWLGIPIDVGRQTKAAFLSNHWTSKPLDRMSPTARVFLGLWAGIYLALAIAQGIPYPTYELLSFLVFMAGAGLVIRLETRRHGGERRAIH